MVFPLCTIKKFHVEIVFVAWLCDLSWEVKIVFLFFKKAPPESSLSFCHLICLFFDCKYHLHLPLFSLIVMAFPACTCEQVHIQHSFEFLCVVSGISVYFWLKRDLRAATRVSMFSPFSLFVFLFSSLHYHTCMFFLILRRVPSDLEVGYDLKSQYWPELKPFLSLFVSKNPCYL